MSGRASKQERKWEGSSKEGVYGGAGFCAKGTLYCEGLRWKHRTARGLVRQEKGPGSIEGVWTGRRISLREGDREVGGVQTEGRQSGEGGWGLGAKGIVFFKRQTDTVITLCEGQSAGSRTARSGPRCFSRWG
jgi:hypothetical protein